MNQKTLRFEGQVKKFFEKFNKYYGHLVRTNLQKKITSKTMRIGLESVEIPIFQLYLFKELVS